MKNKAKLGWKRCTFSGEKNAWKNDAFNTESISLSALKAPIFYNRFNFMKKIQNYFWFLYVNQWNLARSTQTSFGLILPKKILWIGPIWASYCDNNKIEAKYFLAWGEIRFLTATNLPNLFISWFFILFISEHCLVYFELFSSSSSLFLVSDGSSAFALRFWGIALKGMK